MQNQRIVVLVGGSAGALATFCRISVRCSARSPARRAAAILDVTAGALRKAVERG